MLTVRLDELVAVTLVKLLQAFTRKQTGLFPRHLPGVGALEQFSQLCAQRVRLFEQLPSRLLLLKFRRGGFSRRSIESLQRLRTRAVLLSSLTHLTRNRWRRLGPSALDGSWGLSPRG